MSLTGCANSAFPKPKSKQLSRGCCGSLIWKTRLTRCRINFQAACAVASASRARWSAIRRIILYDEPTAGLDPITARTICELALKLRDLEEVSSIYVTHRLEDIDVLASEYVVRDDFGNVLFEHEGDKLCLINTKFIMLKDGDIIFSGSDEQMRESSDPYIHKFLHQR